ncbi:U-scoloptoxin(11)-Sm5a-like isoform X2 [Homarus americanus]|uniref:Uncharacterized protein n=1 Tax=Homarus americanus TaxID=6706 RepID=A0A8J5MX99_HOMAM|nr:U-scoloptoxin(11)-Sm5a-like isoform X2 [Homarus americanus]XP_042225366.1 U-scoloptoxin(11)-Sm5a-like isoform X2 [Homarus americanus]KAG7167273.1 hypothetical protein Hamer_G017183 [Homarus americanus]
MVVAERARVAAAGVLVTLTVVLVTLAAVNATPASTSSDHSSSNLLKHLTFLYKDTYVLYGNGRRSERDLPICSSRGEACNLAHRRFWLTPITERLCRCADRSECPLHFGGLNDTLSQHVSNRAQLKFCGNVMTFLEECKQGEVALKLHRVERQNQPFPSSSVREGFDTHTTVMCRCPWPNLWTLVDTRTPSPTEKLYFYTCNELTKCKRWEECGHIRNDTLESYYMCSCPEHHMCVFKGSQPTHITTQLHFHGHAYTGICTPN